MNTPEEIVNNIIGYMEEKQGLDKAACLMVTSTLHKIYQDEIYDQILNPEAEDETETEDFQDFDQAKPEQKVSHDAIDLVDQIEQEPNKENSQS